MKNIFSDEKEWNKLGSFFISYIYHKAEGAIHVGQVQTLHIYRYKGVYTCALEWRSGGGTLE